jgi:hypothetical protein
LFLVSPLLIFLWNFLLRTFICDPFIFHPYNMTCLILIPSTIFRSLYKLHHHSTEDTIVLYLVLGYKFSLIFSFQWYIEYVLSFVFGSKLPEDGQPLIPKK